MSKWLALLLVVAVIAETRASADLVKHLSIKFVEGLDACMDELDIKDPDPIVYDIKNFWKDDFILSNYMSGCTMHCLASKLELIDEDGYLLHHKMKEFVLKQGTEEETAFQITEIINQCLNNSIPDACNRSMVAGQCVKQKLQDLEWAPPADAMFEEILVEESKRK